MTELEQRLADLRSKAASTYSADDETRQRAWSQYHHALQAAYERGELVVKDARPA